MITHPEKVLFPDDGITKGELAAYYEAMAPVLLPHLRGRPVTMERYPAGIGEPGFWQKDVSRRAFPTGSSASRSRRRAGASSTRSCGDMRVAAVARQPELHHAARLDVAAAGSPPARTSASSTSTRRARSRRCCAACVLALRDLLDGAGAGELGQDVGLEGLPRRGAARRPGRVSARSRGSPSASARCSSSAIPTHLTQEFTKADRGGRILVDTGRNGYGATFAAAYAVRARPGAPVSAPCTWDEVERGDVLPRSFTLRTMAGRVAQVGDPWSDLWQRPQSLAEAREKL